MKGFSDYINYFNVIANDHIDIQSFTFGDSEKILSEENSNLNFPCLWLETPDVKLKESHGDISFNLNGSFVVLEKCPPDEWLRQRWKLDQTMRMTYEILRRMCSDVDENNHFQFDRNEVEIYPIINYNGSPMVGWRAEFNIAMPPTDCQDRFKNVCPVGSISKFHWTNNSEDGFDLEFENLSFPEDAFDIEVKYMVDDGSFITLSDLDPISIAGKCLYIELNLSNDMGCELSSSAIIYPGLNSGYSVAFKLK